MAIRIPHPSCETELRQAFQQLRLSTDALTTGASGYVLVGAGVGNPPTWTTSLTALTALTVDNITVNAATITSDTGAISFGNENLTTTGTIAGINVTSGADPGHTHTGASLSTIDISDDTNLAVTSPIVLTDDTLSLDQSSVDHGSIGGLTDDDHTDYHNDTRGDARYYTQVLLDGGQLDTRYYTETELDAGQLDNRYFTEAEHLDASAGVGDAGKPIKLDAAGHVDATMVNSADVDHDTTTNFVADEHIAHSGVSITAGTGLTGGGDISASRTLSLSHLGIESLADPGADRILFWDDGETACKWLQVSTGLTLSGTTLTTNDSAIDHDSLLNFDSDEHIDWSDAIADLQTQGYGKFTLDADDDIGFEVDGHTNPFSTAATSMWGSRFTRSTNIGTGNLGDEYYAVNTDLTVAHTAAKITDTVRQGAFIFSYTNTGSIQNDTSSERSFWTYGSKVDFDDDGTFSSTSTGVLNVRTYGFSSALLLDQTFDETGGAAYSASDAIGFNIFVRNRPTSNTGNLINWTTGLKIWVIGNTEGGGSIGRGIWIYDTTNCNTNWGIYDESGTNWTLHGDSAKLMFGGGDDASIYYDGTDLHIDSQEVGSGHIILDSPKTTTGDPAAVEGKYYWNTYDNVLKAYCDSAWRIVSDWSQTADRIHFWDQTASQMGWLEVSTGLSLSDTTLTTDDSAIVHDNLSGFVANEHINHTGVTLTAGSGLSGGGDISSNRTFDLDINSLSAAAIASGDFVPFWDITATATNKKITFANFEATLNHDSLTGFVANEHINHTSVSISAGAGLTGGGTIAATRTLSLSHLGIESLSDPGADRILFWDDGETACKWLTVGDYLTLSGTTLSCNPGFVDRGDPSAWDFQVGDFTLDDTWYELDLSSIIPSGTYAVTIYFLFRSAASAGERVAFRENGNSNEYNTLWAATQVTNMLFGYEGIVPVDSNRKIEYKGKVGITQLDFLVKGWWI